MKKHLYSLILLLAIFACDEAEKMLTPLIPTETDTISTSLSDPFEGNALQNPNWKWQAEPPTLGRIKGSWDIGETRDNHLFIDAEPNRNLWSNDTTHLLYQEIETDVFDVETRFTVRWDTSSGATGLIVKSPVDNDWVTLKFWARNDGDIGQIQYQTKMNEHSRDGLTGNARFFYLHGEIELFFRLAKSGDTYTSWYKTHEIEDWIQVGVTEFKLTPPLWLGIYAGIGAGAGQMQVEFEYFRDNLNP